MQIALVETLSIFALASAAAGQDMQARDPSTPSPHASSPTEGMEHGLPSIPVFGQMADMPAAPDHTQTTAAPFHLPLPPFSVAMQAPDNSYQQQIAALRALVESQRRYIAALEARLRRAGL